MFKCPKEQVKYPKWHQKYTIFLSIYSIQQGIDKEPIISEAISVDTCNNLQFSTKESKKELIVTTNIIEKCIFKVNLKGNAIFQEVHLVNTTFQPKPKEASVNDTINHPIVEDSNAFDINITLLIKDDKEGKK